MATRWRFAPVPSWPSSSRSLSGSRCRRGLSRALSCSSRLASVLRRSDACSGRLVLMTCTPKGDRQKTVGALGRRRLSLSTPLDLSGHGPTILGWGAGIRPGRVSGRGLGSAEFGEGRRRHRQRALSNLFFRLASARVSHCILAGVSVPPQDSGTMCSTRYPGRPFASPVAARMPAGRQRCVLPGDLDRAALQRQWSSPGAPFFFCVFCVAFAGCSARRAGFVGAGSPFTSGLSCFVSLLT